MTQPEGAHCASVTDRHLCLRTELVHLLSPRGKYQACWQWWWCPLLFRAPGPSRSWVLLQAHMLSIIRAKCHQNSSALRHRYQSTSTAWALFTSGAKSGAGMQHWSLPFTEHRLLCVGTIIIWHLSWLCFLFITATEKKVFTCLVYVQTLKLCLLLERYLIYINEVLFWKWVTD